jgi:predicted DNA-binding WGR domain protein
MRYRLGSEFLPNQLALPFVPAGLRRVDPSRDMRRFWSADVERDVLGCVVLVRRWGLIGTAGKVRLDEFGTEGEARAAMHRLELRKVRRAYRF